MSSDTSHLLRVDEYGNLDIIHTPECKLERVSAPPFDEWDEYVCPVGRHISFMGYDDLTDSEGNEIQLDRHRWTTNLKPGDYPLTLEWYTPESMFEDAEINFYYDPKGRVDTQNQSEEDHSAP